MLIMPMKSIRISDVGTIQLVEKKLMIQKNKKSLMTQPKGKLPTRRTRKIEKKEYSKMPELSQETENLPHIKQGVTMCLK